MLNNDLKFNLKDNIINKLYEELIEKYDYKNFEFIKHIIEFYINNNYEKFKEYSIIKEEICKLIIMNEGDF